MCFYCILPLLLFSLLFLTIYHLRIHALHHKYTGLHGKCDLLRLQKPNNRRNCDFFFVRFVHIHFSVDNSNSSIDKDTQNDSQHRFNAQRFDCWFRLCVFFFSVRSPTNLLLMFVKSVSQTDGIYQCYICGCNDATWTVCHSDVLDRHFFEIYITTKNHTKIRKCATMRREFISWLQVDWLIRFDFCLQILDALWDFVCRFFGVFRTICVLCSIEICLWFVSIRCHSK